MIIECDQCNTKFRLDDSRISPNGVKVRCTKCQNVFIVTPPPAPEEVKVDEVFTEEKPFSEKPRESFDSAGAEDEQEDGTGWGVFNSDAEGGEEASGQGEGTENEGAAPREEESAAEDKGFGAEQNMGEQASGGEDEDGSQEAPDLSFGGPDFSTLPGLTGQGPATEEEPENEGGEESYLEGKNDGPWFEGVSDHDDGFPEDGLEETPASGETPFTDDAPSADETAPEEDFEGDEPEEDAEYDNQPEEAPAPTNGFDVSAAAEEEAEAEKTPFDEFDFGIEDEQEQGEGAEPEEAANELGATEEEAPENPPVKDEEPENPMQESQAPESDEEREAVEKEPEEDDDDFSLTPPAQAEQPSKESESAGAEKVIPFTTGYNRNGKSAKTGAGDENRFEDLFSRTLSEEKAGEGEEPEAPHGLAEGEELEFDKHDLPPETETEAEEEPAQKPAAGMGVLIAVLIFILGAGAIYFSGVIDNMARTLTATAPADAVQIETISGYIAANKNFGRYFVIEAKIKNASSEAQSIDRITGVIYDDKGKSIATRSVSPGRVVSEDDLKNLTKGELLAQFSDSSGGMIPPKGTVPVMVPFTEIPAGMAEYGLKIIRE